MPPKVCIVTLNWNGLEDTIECLDSLKKVTYPNYEVVVVDNASSGKDVPVLRDKYADYAHVIANDKNHGFSEGNNIAIRYALEKQADYVLLLNNDTVVDPGFLSELVTIAESDKRVGIESAKVYFYDSPNRLWHVGGKVNWHLGTFKTYGANQEDLGQFDQVADRDFVYATAMLIRRRLIDTIGLLDSKFFFGIEEYDYCQRAKKAGFRVVYVPKAKVWHKIGASRKKLASYPETNRLVKRDTGYNGWKNLWRILHKHSPPLFFPLAFVRATLEYVILDIALQWLHIRQHPT
jgi:GT2 family glycosyltransferase